MIKNISFILLAIVVVAHMFIVSPWLHIALILAIAVASTAFSKLVVYCVNNNHVEGLSVGVAVIFALLSTALLVLPYSVTSYVTDLYPQFAMAVVAAALIAFRPLVEKNKNLMYILIAVFCATLFIYLVGAIHTKNEYISYETLRELLEE